jgi:CheY-like chemotaxis protein
MAALQRILYVEDDPDIREVAAIALEVVGGYQLKACDSGHVALQAIESFDPDLLLLDVMMPEMDGPETLQALRDKGLLAEHVPVVFMTAKVHPEEIARYRELGAFDVISKPFDPMNLAKEVGSIWERFRERE